MNLAELNKHADRIPSMGGRQIKKYIKKAVAEIENNSAIVELGTWLGACTAQLAIALKELNKNNHIFSYDLFIVSSRQPLKAAREGIMLTDGQDSFPVVKELLKPFDNITIIKTEIRDTQYNYGPIGLYIDDACKQKKNFDAALNIFSHSFIPEKTILIFMDFYLWLNTHEEDHKYQFNFMQKNKDKFQYIDAIETTYYEKEKREFGAMFLYKGGGI